jgi:hypothetical protein
LRGKDKPSGLYFLAVAYRADLKSANRIALGVDDVARADRALKGIVGKRLTYRATPE